MTPARVAAVLCATLAVGYESLRKNADTVHATARAADREGRSREM